jgi:hypothetical protein
VLLSFTRGLLLSKLLGFHSLALEEFHSVIEHRDALDPRISKSQYFQFMIRELKQAEYDMVKMAEAAATSQQLRERAVKAESHRVLTPRSTSPI